jgi:hypothetical protein
MELKRKNIYQEQITAMLIKKGLGMLASYFQTSLNRRMGKQSDRGFCLIQRQNVHFSLCLSMCSCPERKYIGKHEVILKILPMPLDKEEKQFSFVIA